MSDNLYYKSIVKMNNSYNNLNDSKKSSFLDDAYFEMACFDAQQAVEFILKAVLLEYKITFEKNLNNDDYILVANKGDGHDLTYILQLIDEHTDFSFEKIDSLRALAPTITMWEQKGRYQTGIKTKEETVRRILNIYKNIEKEFLLLKNKKYGNSGGNYGDGNIGASVNISDSDGEPNGISTNEDLSDIGNNNTSQISSQSLSTENRESTQASAQSITNCCQESFSQEGKEDYEIDL